MQEKLAAAEALLPAWFIPRMMSDTWQFGLVMTNGDVLLVQTIDKVQSAADGSLWLDVTLLDTEFEGQFEKRSDPFKGRYVAAVDGRTTASVNAAHVQYAMELAYT